jgi:hypothetical protein
MAREAPLVVELTLTDFCLADGGRVLSRDEVPDPPKGALLQDGYVIDAEVDGVHRRWRYGPEGLIRYVVYAGPDDNAWDRTKIAAVWEAP